MNFQLWFPTLIGINFVSEQTKQTTFQIIQDWIASGDHQKYVSLCKEENLTTSYFIYNDTIGDLKLNDLRKELTVFAKEYINQCGVTVDEENLRLDSWINFFYPGQSEQQHNHYGNLISGVYYVTAPKQSGNFRFFDPALIKTMWKGQFLNQAEENVINQSSSSYVPESGKTILFPSYLEHAVLANKSDEVRISIAYNVNII